MSKSRMRFLVVLALLVAAVALALPIHAQGEVASISVNDQVSDGSVTIASVYSPTSGFVVVRNDGGRGTAPGPVLGFTAVGPGWHYNVPVELNLDLGTARLFASLHADTETAGLFEFGDVADADAPVEVDGTAVRQLFTAQVMLMSDQPVADNTVTLDTVITDAPGWLVIHSDNGGSPGPVLGQSPVVRGRNSNVTVELAAEGQTEVVWPMLHVDTGEAGVYEFGAVEGADSPVRANGQVATLPVWTAPHVRMSPQIAVGGDGNALEGPVTVNVDSVLSSGPGWLVIHSDNAGSPGPVLGQTAVADGTNLDVAVTLDAGDPTAVLWPMLHVDTGVEGEYEFGTVEGADGPVRDSAGNVITFPVAAAPSLDLGSGAQLVENGSITIPGALIDLNGWIAIHSGSEGSPGPVLATYPLQAGWNANAVIPVDEAAAGNLVFPMLHYDTGEPGVYEFGAVEGADGPVRVADAVVVSPLGLGEEAVSGASAAPAAGGGCTLTADAQSVNLRGGPGVDYAVVGSLAGGASVEAVGQATGASGQVWWSLADGSWVRSDVVTESSDACNSLPQVAYAPPPPAPAETAEPGT